MTNATTAAILDGIDQMGRARSLNRMFDIASRETHGPEDDNHAIAALAEAIDGRLAKADAIFQRALHEAKKGKGGE
ncbi:hypothetical protein P1J78_16350 [Psychromarinibacter sp. C21-152]|uniref:Uncharacterized protein n=1 Tax=Psychromarinibacter sediminicola TaxID=3033385 RepID=A0AAE3NX86_9RHOB|nr:hypothetical protein [Psychromarinibacter sediminicola]MDF0602312.1 hypothetical protein [Psychromarinibacter sediminicola]